MSDINLKKVRDALPARREPHWKLLDTGFHIGFRKMPSGSKTWISRVKDGVYKQRSLGPVSAVNDYSAAVGKAQHHRADVDAGIQPMVKKHTTVADVCREYVKDRASDKLPELQYDFIHRNTNRFNLYVYDTPFGVTDFRKLTTEQVKAWRNDIAERTSQSTANRHFRSFKAAMNWGAKKHMLVDRAAWLDVPQFKGADKARKLYLSPTERASIIELANPRLALILTALSYTGARGIELRHAKVSDLSLIEDRESLRLFHYKGDSTEVPEREFPLQGEALKFFKAQADGKKHDDFLFEFRPGQPWSDNQLSLDVKKLRRSEAGVALAEEYGWSEELVSYHFRHSVLSDLLMAGVPISTVAILGGTSVERLQKNYSKFIPEVARELLSAIKLV